ncbi:hypothetical protein EUGRSUZ_E03786 [Eucalyptus grandis]|uniref:Uncharacterized protein n=2 Tax=Eucalyptus grandis TaxID=71139 RepID=A0ACC3L050_EUCGR|nr:hypothetical protein EUGRSUZ_E03786 [Eucalyptus grandis]
MSCKHMELAGRTHKINGTTIRTSLVQKRHIHHKVGLFLCHGDVSTATCSDCVTTGKRDILQKCPNQRVSVIWYDECMLRYSNESVFLVMEEEPLFTMSYAGNIANAAKFLQVLGDTIKDVVWRGSGNRCATAEANVTTSEKLSTIAQCTPDLTPWDCKSNKSTTIIVAVAIPVGVAIIILFVACYLPRSASEITTAESLQYHLAAIQAATNNFSHQNKLGQGGFGEVFRVLLPNGQEIAVRRLSKSSGQGVGEFKNEVVLVAKLQHRNLARLLGFCLEREEKILVYEFVPNKSLDYFLFDPDKRRQLNRSRHHKIISGIARGMLYLHEDSRLHIIHHGDMNPKISDFGMARIFEVDQTQAKTNRIPLYLVCNGYLSPEYAMHGQISVKSDVYSFGVLILEIISGKKNSGFSQSDGGENLASYRGSIGEPIHRSKC